MRLQTYLTEKIDTDKLNTLVKIFSKIPSGKPEAISNFVVNSIKASGIKVKPKGGIYLSGPMTNLPDDNWPVFHHANKYLSGYVVNPGNPHGELLKKATKNFSWEDFMVEDVYGMVDCDKIVFMPGYSKSTGAIVEAMIGKKLMGAKTKTFREHIGKSKYESFIEDVKNQYYKDGNPDAFHSVIEPMLRAKTEKEAASYVKQYIPSSKSETNESIISSTADILRYIKNWTLKEILKVIGMILNKAGVRGLAW